MECFTVKVQDPQGRVTKDVLLYPGIPGSEVQQVLKAAFSFQVAGLANPLLDIYFPTTLFSRVPKYFSKRAPYRIVPVCGGGEWREIGEETKIDRGSRIACSEDTFGVILQELFLTDTEVQRTEPIVPRSSVDRVTPSNARPLNPGLAELRRKLGICTFPAEDVLNALRSTAASDGKLTRAEFDVFLKDLASLLESPTLSTSIQIFELFDEAGGGILHVHDLAAGLAVLCDGSVARSVRCACQLYRGAGGDMGFVEISSFTLSILKVVYAASPANWAWPGMLPRELSAVMSSEFLIQKGLPLSGRVGFEEWFASTIPEEDERSCDDSYGDAWAHLLQGLQNHDMQVILELLAAFVDQHGGISSPAFFGCIRALFEVDGRGPLTDAETAKLKVALTRLFIMLDDHRLGTVPFGDLASGISAFCDKHDNETARALFDIHGNEDGSIAEEDMRKLLVPFFKVMFEVDPHARNLTGTGTRRKSVDPESLAETIAACAFEDATLGPDGAMSFEGFYRWYSSSFEVPSSSVPVGDSPRSLASSDDALRTALDVGEVHRIFKLRDINAAGFIYGLSAASCQGRVSWISFLRYMHGFANARPLTEESRSAVMMARKLFDVYDEDKQREVDLRVLASGLAILCKGSWKDRATALFSVLDTERQGSLSREDMRVYFSSTSKLLCSVQPSVLTSTNSSALTEAFGTSPEEGVNETERFDERMFASLYSDMNNREGCRVTKGTSETLEQARQDTQLYTTPAAHTFGVLKDALNDQGRLTRPAMHRCLRQLRAMVHNQARHRENEKVKGAKGAVSEHTYSSAAAENVMNRLFDAVDVGNVGDVNFCEFASALSVLCGGSREEKMMAIFNLFHRSEGVGITVRDIATFTTSAFRVMYKLQPSLEGEVGITPEVLGNVTASNMMEEVEPNGDGRISPTNFGWWLSDEGNPNGVRRTTAAGFACHSSRVDSVGEGSTQPDEDVTQHDGNARAGFRGDQLEGQGHIVMRARKLLCLDCFSVNDLLEILAEVAIMKQGALAQDDFWRCIGYVLQLGGTAEGTTEWDEAFLLTECIYHAFEGNDGVVAFAAIACGVSILCQSTAEDKVLVAFLLLDTDGDGQLVFEEVSMYIASVLKVVYAIGQGVTAIINPDELGAALATQCFKQAKLAIDAKLGIDDFRLFTR